MIYSLVSGSCGTGAYSKRLHPSTRRCKDNDDYDDNDNVEMNYWFRKRKNYNVT